VRFATEVVLLSAFAVAASTAASATAPTTATAFTAGSVLGRAIPRFNGGLRIARGGDVAFSGRCGGGSIGGRLLLTLPFTLAVALCLGGGITLGIALARLLWVALSLARRLRGVAIAAMFAVASAAAMLAMALTSAFLVAMTAILLAVAVAPLRAAVTIPIAITATFAMALLVTMAAMPRTAAVAVAVAMIAVAIPTRFAAGRRRFGGSTRSVARE